MEKEKEMWEIITKIFNQEEVPFIDVQKAVMFLYGLYVGTSTKVHELQEEKEFQQKEFTEKLLRYEGTFQELDNIYEELEKLKAKNKGLEETIECSNCGWIGHSLGECKRK